MEPLPPSRIDLFNGSGSPTVDVEELADYGRGLLGDVEVTRHGDFIGYCLGKCDPPGIERLKDEVALMLSDARVTDPSARTETGKQLRPVIEYERRMLEREPPRPVGVLYDGIDLCAAYNLLLSSAGIPTEGLVVVVTNQLVGTFDENDSRYHARVVVFGYPCVISTSGLVEAPAKPRAHYIGQQLGLSKPPSEEEMPEKWLRPDDPRTTEVLKGYLAQAIFYYMTGEPFCEERECRLFNAHWQEDLLHAQLDGGSDLCAKHERMLAEILEET
jgi:hypothetical protein